MPRKARCQSDAPYYHIMVQGLNKEYVFKNDDLKAIFLRILMKYTKENNVQLIAYCIMGTHAHILIKRPETKVLTRCMIQINATFAAQYNKKFDRVGYVFRDRYNTEEVFDLNYLHNCIKYIHMNPVKARMCLNQSDYKFSSYNNYLNKSGFVTNELLQEIFNLEDEYIKTLDEELPKYEFMEEKITIREAEDWIKRYLNTKNMTLEFIKRNKGVLKIMLEDMKRECEILNKDIAGILSVDKSKISRILNEK